MASALAWPQVAAAQAADRPVPERVARGNDRPLAEPEGTQRFTLATPLRETAYLVQVWTPAGPPPPAGWPVLYAMDGKAIFDLLARRTDLAKLKTVIVGVSYDSPGRMDFRARSYDYTPPSPGDDAPVGLPRDPYAQGRVPPGGGAETFLTYLLDVVEPAVDRQVRIDPARRSLYGHSYGGLFVLYAYLTRPHAFTDAFAASPSLWWNRQALMQRLSGWRPPTQGGARLALMVGGGEVGADVQASAAAAFRRTVAQGTGAGVSFEVMPELGHGPMMPASLARTLETLGQR